MLSAPPSRRWFSLTVSLIVAPLIVVNVFSIVWFHQDHENSAAEGFLRRRSDIPKGERILLAASHLFLVGPAVR